MGIFSHPRASQPSRYKLTVFFLVRAINFARLGRLELSGILLISVEFVESADICRKMSLRRTFLSILHMLDQSKSQTMTEFVI